MTNEKNPQRIEFKSERALKNISVESAAMSKQKKAPSIYFTTPSEKDSEKTIQKESTMNPTNQNEGHFLKVAIDAAEDERQAYNANLTNLDPRYSSLTPLNSFIVRLHIRDEMRTKSGIILPGAKIKSQSHSGMAEYSARDPFQFTGKAVIVSVPKFETELCPGDIVQIVRPQLFADKEEVLGYDVAYAHPDYQLSLIPTSPDHPDFGYAIVGRGSIKVLIEKAKTTDNEVE